eukprot:gene11433-9934_t
MAFGGNSTLPGAANSMLADQGFTRFLPHGVTVCPRSAARAKRAARSGTWGPTADPDMVPDTG